MTCDKTDLNISGFACLCQGPGHQPALAVHQDPGGGPQEGLAHTHDLVMTSLQPRQEGGSSGEHEFSTRLKVLPLQPCVLFLKLFIKPGQERVKNTRLCYK